MRPACPTARAGFERCLTLWRPQAAVNRARAAGVRGAAAQPAGWGPADIEAAYKLPVSAGSGQTVAVVEAWDTPSLEAYLGVYRAQYGLPACTAASGCFRKVNQAGQASPLPASGVDAGTDLEATLDVDMVSAACPKCKILVVEANTPAFADMAAADNTAARLGAQVISTSYGIEENGQTQALAGDYRHPGHIDVVSAGDYGFGPASFPANLATVTAVGGTELSRDAGTARGWSEQVWYDSFGASASGCSAWVAKPSWQKDTDCHARTVGDVSAVAANIPVYEADYGGWVTAEGTSAAAPLIAGVYALAGNATKITPGYPYTHAAHLNDVTTGDNDPLDAIENSAGAICGHDYICTAKPGYDAPTGLGTPNGTGAF
jgi:subtilase family serine protease